MSTMELCPVREVLQNGYLLAHILNHLASVPLALERVRLVSKAFRDEAQTLIDKRAWSTVPLSEHDELQFVKDVLNGTRERNIIFKVYGNAEFGLNDLRKTMQSNGIVGVEVTGKIQLPLFRPVQFFRVDLQTLELMSHHVEGLQPASNGERMNCKCLIMQYVGTSGYGDDVKTGLVHLLDWCSRARLQTLSLPGILASEPLSSKIREFCVSQFGISRTPHHCIREGVELIHATKTHLKVITFHADADKGLIQSLQSFPNLSAMHIRSYAGDLSEISAIRFPALEKLILNGHLSISLAGREKWKKGPATLTKLEIWCQGWNDPRPLPNMRKCFRNLTTVIMRGSVRRAHIHSAILYNRWIEIFRLNMNGLNLSDIVGGENSCGLFVLRRLRELHLEPSFKKALGLYCWDTLRDLILDNKQMHTITLSHVNQPVTSQLRPLRSIRIWYSTVAVRQPNVDYIWCSVE